ncbi:peptidoglycan/LPS O-acetylase OafA/YrhL [Microvirga flocculans]|uniref:Peptidoglycan/LPS O-acetylase OafA/YrhL n=1 Tax=Microvirga flocculans TaxID=217168 RepID=A0A7W6N8X5_9HYPH|nr:acyltransferase [Microvirga flocculans]MBB4040863.1 peptidoglycan/LPS O-acetylase OafA/YrhL [Microvirga flocculans]
MEAWADTARAGIAVPVPSERAAQPEKLLSVQALRAVAALLVLVYHIANHAAVINHVESVFDPARHFGFAGVDLFFVISGFIMIHTSRHLVGRSEERLPFIWRRLTRIYPIYWVVWIGSGVLISVLGSKGCYQTDALLNHVKSFLLLPTTTDHCFVTQAWTLNYEVYFYLIFALVFFLPARLALLLSVAWAAYSFVATFLLPSISPKELRVFNGFNLYFMLGCLIALVPRGFLVRLAWPLLVLGCSFFVLSAVMVATDGVKVGNVGNRFILFGISSGIVLSGAVGLEARGVLRPPAWLVRLGDASYSIYLTHLAVIIGIDKAVRAAFPWMAGSILWDLATFSVSLAVGLGLYRRVERPMMRALRRLGPH